MRTVYPSYLFHEHDPVLDLVDTLIADRGVTLNYIETKSGVTTSTLYNWQRRKTKRPQYATVAAVCRALGAEITIAWKEFEPTALERTKVRERTE